MVLEFSANGLLVNAGLGEIGGGCECESNLVHGCCHLAFARQGAEVAVRDRLADVVLPEGEGARLLVVGAKSAAQTSKNPAANGRRADEIHTLPAQGLLAQNMAFVD